MKANAARQLQTDVEHEARGHGDKLDRKTEAAIVALLAHPTMPEAAKAAGVSETTLWRWLQRDDFRKKYREAQDKVFEGAQIYTEEEISTTGANVEEIVNSNAHQTVTISRHEGDVTRIKRRIPIKF